MEWISQHFGALDEALYERAIVGEAGALVGADPEWVGCTIVVTQLALARTGSQVDTTLAGMIDASQAAIGDTR
ncbi:hypothetical protein [Streptomyces phytophilus]|uniref:hypothetical protein n=1 Tax=Streptomyces phytophilus TaxID=722715 RepID=UPI0015F09EB2|nr:hypothetical protein [Streptomyces phytophilus]